MYASAFVLGFHGCDRYVGEKILRGEEHISQSGNAHDWLGEGAYFWENNPRRAIEWAEFIKAHPTWYAKRVEQPFAIGAIIDLGHCLDLTEANSLSILQSGFNEMKERFSVAGIPIPANEKGNSHDEDLVKRKRDCAAINFLHMLREAQRLSPYNTVRGAFSEGAPLYEGAGIMAKTHVQIAVRSPSSIRGYFRPIVRGD